MPDSKKPNRILIELLLSAVLALAMMALTDLIRHLPFSAARDRLSDALSWPALLITGLFYPEGIHTGHGSVGAIYVSIASFIGFYWVAWFLLLDIGGRVARRRATKK